MVYKAWSDGPRRAARLLPARARRVLRARSSGASATAIGHAGSGREAELRSARVEQLRMPHQHHRHLLLELRHITVNDAAASTTATAATVATAATAQPNLPLLREETLGERVVATVLDDHARKRAQQWAERRVPRPTCALRRRHGTWEALEGTRVFTAVGQCTGECQQAARHDLVGVRRAAVFDEQPRRVPGVTCRRSRTPCPQICGSECCRCLRELVAVIATRELRERKALLPELNLLAEPGRVAAQRVGALVAR